MLLWFASHSKESTNFFLIPNMPGMCANIKLSTLMQSWPSHAKRFFELWELKHQSTSSAVIFMPFDVLDGWMHGNETTPSMHHLWWQNVIISMVGVGLNNGHICKNLTQNGEHQRYSWECRRRILIQWLRPWNCTFCFQFDVYSRSQLYQNINCCAHLLTNFSIDLDDIKNTAMTCWVVETYAKFYFTWLIFKGNNSCDLFKRPWTLACVWVLMNQFLSNLVWR